jgi:hypothetical protein
LQLIEDRQETDKLAVTMEYTYALEGLERVQGRRLPERRRK